MTQPSPRIAGYDVARALAILGMIVVNFDVSITGGNTIGETTTLERFAQSFQGRASALFVVLAGVGLSLMTRRAREQGGDALRVARRRIIKRALFFFVVGVAFLPLWSGDILHYYGVFFLVGAVLFAARDATLWAVAAVAPIVFVVMLTTLDYNAGWVWSELRYEGLWTAEGFVRNTFFNGFHPVVPWIAFFAVGIWLGRRTMNSTFIRYLAFIGIAGMMLVDLWQEYGIAQLLTHYQEGSESDLAVAIGTTSMPPVPMYILKGSFGAVGVIGISMILIERLGEKALAPLIATGQLAFTHYIGHVVIGLGALEALGKLENGTIEIALTGALAYSAAAVVFSTVWRRHYDRGPLEWVLRKIAP